MNNNNPTYVLTPPTGSSWAAIIIAVEYRAETKSIVRKAINAARNHSRNFMVTWRFRDYDASEPGVVFINLKTNLAKIIPSVNQAVHRLIMDGMSPYVAMCHIATSAGVSISAYDARLAARGTTPEHLEGFLKSISL